MHFSQSFVEASSESPEKVRKQSVCVRSECHALQTDYLHSHLNTEVKPRVTAQHMILVLDHADCVSCLSRMRCVTTTLVSARSAFCQHHVVYFIKPHQT